MHKTIPSHSRNPLIQRLIERNPGMAIGNSVPIDLSLLEDIEQSANQLSSQLDALLAGLRSQLQQVALQEPLSLSLSPPPPSILASSLNNSLTKFMRNPSSPILGCRRDFEFRQGV